MNFSCAFEIISRGIRLNQVVFYCTLAWLLSGCLGARYLKDDEKLLYKQKFKGAKHFTQDELDQLVIQEPNKRFVRLPFAPYVWLYESGERRFDPSKYERKKQKIESRFQARIDKRPDKINRNNRLTRKMRKKMGKMDVAIRDGNLLMRWGEPLSVHDPNVAQQTADKIRLYLLSKGYFNATTSVSPIPKGKKRIIEYYKIRERDPYVIDSIIFQSTDTAAVSIALSLPEEPALAKGNTYDQQELATYRDQITEHLKNSGYFGFSKQFITYEIDTTLGDHRVAVRVRLNTPQGKERHRVYRHDSVTFTTDADITGIGTDRKRRDFREITYRYYSRNYSEKVLNQRILLRPDSLYSRQKTLRTQRLLANLDVFKFINVNYDTTGGHFITNIFTSPLDRYQISNEVGFDITQGRIPGPFVSSSLKIRNLFKGLEIVQINGSFGLEGIGSANRESGEDVGFSDIYNLELNANLGIQFPRFIFPGVQSLKSKPGLYNQKTEFSAGYSNIIRQEYNRQNINFTGIYRWFNQGNNQFSFSPLDISLIETTRKDTAFFNLIEDLSTNLINSFNTSIVSSMYFTGLFNTDEYGANTGSSSYIRAFLESGGTYLNFFGSNTVENSRFETYKFLKFEIDYRRLIHLNSKNNLAFRTNVGLAYPYSSNETLPYEKFFFIGGSNSLRAWRPRRLGPGGYTPPRDENGQFDYSLEQPGEIMMLYNLELRKKLIGFMEGAIFLDAGNIWTFRDDPREDASFRFSRFYKEIALGTGLGFRFNFSYLILRFDLGIKVHDPAEDPGNRFVLDDISFFGNRSTTSFNLGVGYPF